MIWESRLKCPLQISFIDDCVVPQEVVRLIIDSVEDWISEEDNSKQNDIDNE